MTTRTAEMLVLCAWCERHGHQHGAARDAQSGEWRAVPLAYVRARWAAASHGVCHWCLPALARAWRVEQDMRAAVTA